MTCLNLVFTHIYIVKTNFKSYYQMSYIYILFTYYKFAAHCDIIKNRILIGHAHVHTLIFIHDWHLRLIVS